MGPKGCLPYLIERTAYEIQIHASKLGIKFDGSRPLVKWTAEEQDILCRVYPKKGIAGCIPLLPDRSENAIQVRASLLGIKRNTDKMQRNEWTKEELDILRHEFPKVGVEGCARLLKGRTVAAIHRQSIQLGLKKTNQINHREWSKEEVEILRHVYPREGVQGCLPLLPGRSDKAITIQAHNRGIKRKRDSSKSSS